MVKKIAKKILIIDEEVFTHVCRAILELEGYKIETHKIFGEKSITSNFKKIGLIITSYPFCMPLLIKLSKFDIPKIILIDTLSQELIALMQNITQFFCMVKPIDFIELRALVKKILINNDKAYKENVCIL